MSHASATTLSERPLSEQTLALGLVLQCKNGRQAEVRAALARRQDCQLAAPEAHSGEHLIALCLLTQPGADRAALESLAGIEAVLAVHVAHAELFEDDPPKPSPASSFQEDAS